MYSIPAQTAGKELCPLVFHSAVTLIALYSSK